MKFIEKTKVVNRKAIIIMVIALIFIVLGGVGLAKHNKAYNIEQGLASANNYIKDGDSKNAIIEFHKVISLNPVEKEAYLGLAKVYMSQNNPNDAIKTLTDGYEVTNDLAIKNAMEDIKTRIKVTDINKTISIGEKYKLPGNVTISINDTKAEYPVKWDTDVVDTKKEGAQSFKGVLKNTDKEVILTLNIVSIVSINDVNKQINQNDKYSLPSHVDAKISDDTIAKVLVTWNPGNIDTSTVGTYQFDGVVNGYDNKVKLKLNIKKPYTKGDELSSYNSLLIKRTWLKDNGVQIDHIVNTAYEDLDQDGVQEMIIHHQMSRADSTVSIITYNNGDIKVEHIDEGQSYYGGYYKPKKTFFVDGQALGFYWTYGYKLINGRSEEVFKARCELDVIVEGTETFELNGKKVTEAEYIKFLASFGKKPY